MDRYKLLAAELFGYSYDNYEDHLGIGHIRFEKLMPTTPGRWSAPKRKAGRWRTLLRSWRSTRSKHPS
jgi:hypothetical protein